MEGEGLVRERRKKKKWEKGGLMGEIEQGDRERKRKGNGFSKREREVEVF